MPNYAVTIETQMATDEPIKYYIRGVKSYDEAVNCAIKQLNVARKKMHPELNLPDVIVKPYDEMKHQTRPLISVMGNKKVKYYTWDLERSEKSIKDKEGLLTNKQEFYVVTAWFDEHDPVPVALCSTEDKAKKAEKIVEEKAIEMQREGEISNYSCHYEPMKLDVVDWFDIKKNL